MTGAPGATRTASVPNGTWKVYTYGNEYTGVDIVINGAPGDARFDQYTGSYTVNPQGAATGGTFSAAITGIGGGNYNIGFGELPASFYFKGDAVTFTATGEGAGSYTYAWSGTHGGAQISGTGATYTIPSVSGTINLTCSITGTGTAPTITTTTLPNGTVGEAYSQTLVATGTTPFTWSLDSGALPGGLTISSAGVISGTPTTAETATFTVKATNGVSPDATKSLSITVNPVYGVSIGSFSGGSVSADKYSAAENETVTLTLSGITAGYELASIAAHKTGDENTTVSLSGSGKNNGATYTFAMPAYGVTVTATFEKTQATLDAEAVANAKTAIEAGAYTVEQATANTEVQLKAWLATQINGLIASTSITVLADDITLSNFTAASDGNDGSFIFTAALSKGSATGSAGKDGIITATPVYNLTIGIAENGSVSAGKATAAQDETVTLTITPAEGYEPDVITAHKTGDINTSVSLSGSGAIRTFTMPGYDVTVTATFRKTQETLDAEAVATAKTAIENRSYTVAQATANTPTAVKTWLVSQINDLIASTGITVSEAGISLSNFTAASNGNDGSFNFSASLTKGSATGNAGKSGIISATPIYTVTIGTSENGSVAADKTSITAGETVTLTITPATGYELASISAHKTGDVNTSVSLSGSGTTRSFTMPGYDVTVTAAFGKTQETLDAEAVATAKTAIEAGAYTVTQATANAEAQLKAWLATQINGLIASTGITVSATDISLSNFTAAADGNDGSFTFTVSLAKGSATGSAGKDGSITATPVYTLTIGIVENGSVSADKTSITAGETVTLTLTPAEGYEPDAITAYKTGDLETSLTLNGTGHTRTFVMPGYDVTVQATFKKTQEQSDKEAVEAAKAAIEGGTYRVAQATANDAASVKTWLVNTLNLLFGQSHNVQFRSGGTPIDAEISITAITPAVAGTEASPAGTDGMFSFTVSLSKGASNATADVSTGVIVAMPHVFTPVKRIELLLSGSLTLRILNTGNIATGELSLALSGTNADVFTLPSATLPSLSVGDEAAITLIPRTGLTPGTYTATLTVSANGLTSVSQEITYTVLPTGMDSPPSKPLKAYVQNGTLHISGLTPGKPWSLYSISGALVYQSIAQSEEGYATLPVRGIYIVKSEKDTIKVIY
jgi:anti-sigma28 factor (negative regulator of flagellin synthesis)